MKIKEIDIKNFRKLKDVSIKLEDTMSLIIGKNNVGKTSVLTLLEKFLLNDKNNFSYDDFSISARESFEKRFSNDEFTNNEIFEISMLLNIKIDENDSLKNINEFFMDLNPENKNVYIKFSYWIDDDGLKKLVYKYNENIKNNENIKDRSISKFLKREHKQQFKISYYTISEDGNTIKELENKKSINKILCFKRVGARREISNIDGTRSNESNALSKKANSYYTNNHNYDDILLENTLIQANEKLNEVYDKAYEGICNKIEKLGGINEKKLKIISNLTKETILKNNIEVLYSNNNVDLPESYNGLGYMNLLYMIFEIEIIKEEFKRLKEENQIDMFLLFIEEPEAHTHPQMQYIFSENIITILNEIKGEINLQTIVTTHSPHIISRATFDNIKYFCEKEQYTIIKDIDELEKMYLEENEGEDEESKNADVFRFIKQYLTLSRCELFFSDKAILVEGDTERILIPAFMKKIDNNSADNAIPLLSQNISIIDVGGAYAHKFDKLLKFLDIKTLIITDIDYGKKDVNSSRNTKTTRNEADCTTNQTLKHYFKDINENIKRLSNIKSEINNKLYIAFQKIEEGYYARSFEDAFLNINKEFIEENISNISSFKSSNNTLSEKITDKKFDEIEFKSKGKFATEILFYSNDNMDNWKTPKYIEEGLKWIKNN